jgi:ankyrin repeat protein
MNVEEFFNAAWKGDLERTIKILKEGEIDVNAKNKYGNTALTWASQNGHIEIVKYLLANGANPTIRTNEDHWKYPNMTACDIVTRGYQKEIVFLLENAERIWEADIKCKEGQYEEAIEEYSKAIELEPKNRLAYEHRGIAKANMGLYESAIEDYQTVLKIEHEHI